MLPEIHTIKKFFFLKSIVHFQIILNTAVDYSLVAMVTDLCHHLTYESMGAWHTVYAMLLSNYKLMQPEI